MIKVQVMVPMVWELDENHPMIQATKEFPGIEAMLSKTTPKIIQNALDYCGANERPDGTKPWATLATDPSRETEVV